MKKLFLILTCVMLATFLFTGCNGNDDGTQGDSTDSGQLTYSNMVDKATQEEIGKRLTDANIDPSNAAAFFAMVDDYNGLMGNMSEFHNGFTDINGNAVDYAEDTYSKWMETRNYSDANCRITVFTLLQDFITFGNTQPLDPFLAMDADALQNYSLCKMDDTASGQFAALFNPVKVDSTTDADVVLKALQAQWKDRGIQFKEGSASMVSVLMSSELDNIGYIGHTGLMIEGGDGVLFLEKLSQTAPYQALKFQSRDDVKKYLLDNYGSFYTEGASAKPTILINDQLL